MRDVKERLMATAPLHDFTIAELAETIRDYAADVDHELAAHAKLVADVLEDANASALATFALELATACERAAGITKGEPIEVVESKWERASVCVFALYRMAGKVAQLSLRAHESAKAAE